MMRSLLYDSPSYGGRLRTTLDIQGHDLPFKAEDNICSMIDDKIIDRVTTIRVSQGYQTNTVSGEELHSGQEPR